MPIQLPAADLDHILGHTRELWAEMKGQRLFLTGGTGFIGGWLLESFAQANEALGLGAQVTVLTRDRQAFAQQAPHLFGRSDIQFLDGQLRDFKFPEGSFAYLIHAAADTRWSDKSVSEISIFENILLDTKHVLTFAAQAGVKKFLFTSSGAVYGRQPDHLTHMTEEYTGGPDPLSTDAGYGEAKRMAEYLCSVQSRISNFEFKLARCFAFVGPRLPLDKQYAVGNFTLQALLGRPIQVNGDGTPMRSYLYAADLAVWLWTILFKGASGRSYNVGSSQGFTIADIAQCVRSTLEVAEPVKIMRVPVPDQPIQRYIPSVQRAESELGLKSCYSLEEGIRRMANWCLLRAKAGTPLG